MGTSYGVLSTGIWNGPPQNGVDLAGGVPIPDEFDPELCNTYDNVEFTVEMIAPDDAAGFALDYVFMSSEYEEYIGSHFNDKFYIQLQAPSTGEEIVINTTACSDPGHLLRSIGRGREPGLFHCDQYGVQRTVQ